MVNRKLRVFLCHASQDKPIVRKMYHHLVVQEWIDPWLDEQKLLPGQDWETEIGKAIEISDAVIVCLSKHSVIKEGYIQKELRKVLDVANEKPEGTIFVIPLRLDDCDVPKQVSKFQFFNLFPEEQIEWVYERIYLSLDARANSLGLHINKELLDTHREKILLPISNLKRIKPDDLAPYTIVASQMFDRFWVPKKLLRRMIDQHLTLGDVASQLSHAILREWRKILLYSQQIVIHESSLLNNEIIGWDCLSPENRPAFRKMLEQEILIPYLRHFNSNKDTLTFSVSPHSNLIDLWQRLFQNTRITCIRLDWQDGKMDYAYTENAFHRYIQTLNMPDRSEFLSHALQISKRQRSQFDKTLLTVASYAFDIAGRGQTITREQLYKTFICAEGTNPTDGIFTDKPFSAELKQIFDLKYNSLLPDILSRNSETPLDSLSKDALGEVGVSIGKSINDSDLQEITDALTKIEFLPIGAHTFLIANDMSYLSLNDILNIRNTPEWKMYTRKLNNLVLNPINSLSSNGIQDFILSFAKLNEKVLTVNKAVKNKALSLFDIALFVRVGNSHIRISQQESSQKNLADEFTSSISVGVSPLEIELIITSFDEHRYKNVFNFPVLKGLVSNGRDCFYEIKNRLKNSPKFIYANYQLVSDNKTSEDNESDWDSII